MISIRLPREHDLDRLLTWRNREAVRAVSLNQRPIEREQHQAWFRRLLLDREGELGIVCHDRRPVGVVQLDRLDIHTSEATWGCHLGDVDVPPGFGATLPILGIALGIRGWGLSQLDADVIETNKNMLGIHRRLAIRRVEPNAAPAQDGTEIRVFRFQVTEDEFPGIVERAERLFPRALSESLTNAIVALGSWRER